MGRPSHRRVLREPQPGGLPRRDRLLRPKRPPAVLCGDAVIVRPGEDVPHTAHLLVEILLEAGLPPEVVQLVHGEGSVVGKAMVEHPDVPVVSFTGSTETGSVIGATCGRMHKRLSLEMGGKNAMLVMD